MAPASGTRPTAREDRDDVGVREIRDEVDLAQKPLATDADGDHRFEDLARNPTAGVAFAGEISDRHAPASQLPLQRVAFGKSRLQTAPAVAGQ